MNNSRRLTLALLCLSGLMSLVAVAGEAEFTAEAQKNRALVILAEAEVPKAMAEAFRSGHMGIMDYYRMKNVVADTSMRKSIAGDSDSETT